MDTIKKEENFKRIAERRTNEVLEKIASFKNFTNKSFYKYDKDQLEKIFRAIVEQVKESMEVLQNALEEE